MWRVALFLLLTGLLATGQGWENDYDQPLNFNCPSGQSISSIRSEHHNFYEDRRWDFDCKPTSKAVDCYWSPYINNFDQTFTFECKPQYALAGMSSHHDNYYEDRMWRFYCCESKCISGNCQWTSYVNYFDEYIYWTVPPHSFLVGADSYHQNFQEDRRWKYKYCGQQSC
ncbi:hemagglutinin/amebocyte aggregation factor-like [Sinocyclocheilus anshuiensis]|uniref:Hemagglutinin/amebocyte aggregation factor-like n=1 Tax=Sinocyclocheilus anshuiensis TaxID=1608454 RepID=A0A671TAH4_9TELE|nr:PREDICTED: hemagglutinin/amebocyte aggregation factor-like [Sinocyclocheilus anshuiensis]